MNIFRLIIVSFFLLFTVQQVNAQQITQKYNSLYERTEFFDSYGRMIGYAKYNSLYDRLEYYDKNGNLFI